MTPTRFMLILKTSEKRSKPKSRGCASGQNSLCTCRAAKLERIFGFCASEILGLATRVLSVIAEAVSALRHSPYLGRRVGEDHHELVVSHGKTGFVVLYRY